MLLSISRTPRVNYALRGAIHLLGDLAALALATVERRWRCLVQARSASSESHCSTLLTQGVPSLAYTRQFTRSACVGGQPRGVKPDPQCPVSQEKRNPVTESVVYPNCTDARGLVTQPAWLTHVNRRRNPRKYGRAYGNYWPQPKGNAAGRRSHVLRRGITLVAGGKTEPKRGIDATRGTWQSRPLALPATLARQANRKGR